MNSLRSNPFMRSLFTGLLSAAMFAASWTAIGGLWPLIFISFIPLFFILKEINDGRITNKQGVLIIVFTFFCWNIGTLYFVSFLEYNWFIRIVSQLIPVGINTVLMSSVFIFYNKSKQLSGHFHWVVFIALWLTIEWFQHHWAMAFPWLSLGNVFASDTAFIQWYEFTGIGGGSLWVLLVNVLFYEAIETKNSVQKLNRFARVAVALAIPIACSLWLYQNFQEGTKSLKTVVVQPCLSNSDEKFEPKIQQENLISMLQLAQEANDAADLVVFPETAIFEPGQFLFKDDSLKFQGLWLHQTKLSFTEHIINDYQSTFGSPTVIAGVFSSEYFPPGIAAPSFADYIEQLDASVLYYNSALIVRPESTEFRHKAMLVPGVETIPMASVLPFLNTISVNLGGIVGSLGRQEIPIPVQLNPNVNAGILICYDSAFGWLGRKLAKDANILVIITNDSWWGDTPGYKQLLSFAQLRAVETRKSILRSANNGISAIISPKGELIKQLPWNEKGALTAEINSNEDITFYVQYGDLIYNGSTLIMGLLLVFLAYSKFLQRKY